jgi:peroxiredoxin 2/4
MKPLFLSILVCASFFSRAANDNTRNLIPLIGDMAPAFSAESTLGTIHFPADYGNNWKIIFSHPRDFTPVCSTELLELANAQGEFEKLGTSIIVISTDQLETHFLWKDALEEIDFKNRGTRKINFPLVDDQEYLISGLYGMSHPNAARGSNIRGVFFIDRANRIRAIYFYPNEVGRSTAEIIRTLKALQKTDDNVDLKTPADWQEGEPTMIAHPNPLMVENMAQPGSIYFQYAWFMVYWKNKE